MKTKRFTHKKSVYNNIIIISYILIILFMNISPYSMPLSYLVPIILLSIFTVILLNRKLNMAIRTNSTDIFLLYFLYLINLFNLLSVDYKFEALITSTLIILVSILTLICFTFLEQHVLNKILNSFLILIMIINMLGVVMLVFDIDYFLGIKHVVMGRDTKRISSIVGNPNKLGILNTLALMNLFYLVSIDKIKIRMFFIYLISIIITIFILTGSRNSILTTIVFIITYYILVICKYRKYSQKMNKIFWFMNICFVIIAIILTFSVINKGIVGTISIFMRGDYTLSERDIAWNYLLDLFSDNYLLGIGLGNTYNYLSSTNIGVYSAHNNYIGLLAELGLIGFSILFILISLKLYQLIKLIKCNNVTNEKKILLRYVLCFGVSISIYSIMEVSFLVFGCINLIIFMYFALINKIYYEYRTNI